MEVFLKKIRACGTFTTRFSIEIQKLYGSTRRRVREGHYLHYPIINIPWYNISSVIYRKFFIFLVTSLKNECKRLEYIIQQIRNSKQLCKDFSLSSHLVSLGLKTHDALFYSLSIFLYIFLTSFQSLFYCIEYVFLWPIKCAVIWISHSCAKFKKAAMSKYFFLFYTL